MSTDLKCESWGPGQIERNTKVEMSERQNGRIRELALSYCEEGMKGREERLEKSRGKLICIARLF